MGKILRHEKDNPDCVLTALHVPFRWETKGADNRDHYDSFTLAAILFKNNITTMSELLKMDPDKILNLKGMGKYFIELLEKLMREK